MRVAPLHFRIKIPPLLPTAEQGDMCPSEHVKFLRKSQMASVKEHYDVLLSEVYTWLLGGFLEAKNRNSQFFKSKNITPSQSGIAIDLGAGSGFQSIPLAEIGFSVTAIDLSEALLQELNNEASDLKIKTIQDDIINFDDHLDNNVELIICMTDTITHLESKEKVVSLFNKSFKSLEKGGKFILTFRDLTHELNDLDRFLPVKSDESTIFTCFLEYEPETVKVHDIVYRKIKNEWVLQKSFYRKVKLSKTWVDKQLTNIGFSLEESSMKNGLITIIAIKNT